MFCHIYVRFIDIEKQIVQETFLEVKGIVGHPDGSNIFHSMMKVFHPDNESDKLPLAHLASITTDGAAMTISQRGGVAGKLKAAVNPKLFVVVLLIGWYLHQKLVKR